jgi:hypothetical protein
VEGDPVVGEPPALITEPALDFAPGQPASVLDSANISLTTVNGVTVVVASAGRVDQLRGDGSSVVVAVSVPGRVQLVELARDSGRELHRATVSGLGGVSGMRKTPQGWVLTSGSTAATVDLASGDVHAFKLPGELLSAG